MYRSMSPQPLPKRGVSFLPASNVRYMQKRPSPLLDPACFSFFSRSYSARLSSTAYSEAAPPELQESSQCRS
jgi:hypothetical protein